MPDTPDQHADLVLRGGRIATMDAARSWVSALAVRGGRIVATGPDRDLAGHIGLSTRVIELHGRTVTPGFQDAHVHPVHGGLARLRCELHGTRGREAYLAVIAEYAASHPDETWIRGGGWYMGDFPGGTPRREDIDAIVPDRPVFLTNQDGHGAWVNSRALELGGVTVDTTDPADGRIERDPDGSPTGTLHEGAMDLVERLVPVFRRSLGDENVVPTEMEMGGEDFSQYGRAGVPIVMFRLGTIEPRRLARMKQLGQEPPSLHSASYYPDAEESLITGIQTTVAAALELLKK